MHYKLSSIHELLTEEIMGMRLGFPQMLKNCYLRAFSDCKYYSSGIEHSFSFWGWVVTGVLNKVDR